MDDVFILLKYIKVDQLVLMNDKHELDVEQHRDEYFFSHELIFQNTLI